jgi:phage head maturation protease
MVSKSQFEFNVFFKTAHNGKREIEGYAATTDVDRDGEMFPMELLKRASAEYLKTGTLLFEHGTDPTYARKTIGKIYHAEVDSMGRMYVQATISDDWIWKKIELGELQAFSIGGSAQWEWQMVNGVEVGVAKSLEIYETSIVSIPANPNAMFSIAKSLEVAMEKSKEEVKLYNEDRVADNNNSMEELIKSLQEKFENFVSSDEEKKELKKSISTIEEEKAALEAKVEELTKSLEAKEIEVEEMKKSVTDLDAKLDSIIETKKKAQTDEEVEKGEEEVKPEDVQESVDKAYQLVFKK